MGQAKKKQSPQMLEARIIRFSMSFQDFQHARAYLAEYKIRRKDILRRALMEAAIVAYCRPFSANEDHERATGSVQLSLKKLLTSKQLQLHKDLEEVRNTAVAHADYVRNNARRVDRLRPGGLMIAQTPFDAHRRGINPADFMNLCRVLAKACVRGMADTNLILYGASSSGGGASAASCSVVPEPPQT